GRRKMMVLYFFGLAASCGLVALTQNAWQIAAGLTLMGLFASIYHPVGIPMLLRHAAKPGMVIGWNNLAGNMGIALAALFTGLAIKYFGWRAAFWLAALLSIALGLFFLKVCPTESEPAGKRKASGTSLPRDLVIRALVVMTTAATSGAILFNFTTNSNAELLKVKFDQVVTDPAVLGFLLAGVYAVAAFSQVAAGWLLDRVALKKLFMTIVSFQIAFLLAAHGLALPGLLIGLHGGDLWCHSIRGCSDRSVCGRQHAQQSHRHAHRHYLWGQQPGGLPDWANR
ncbi:MAG: MFS transporter, partial [Burkholderiaceae bacterium]